MEYKKKQNKVGIVCLNTTRAMVPFEDKSYDWWSINHGCDLFREKIRLCFDLHDWPNAEYTVSYYDDVLIKEKLPFPIVVPKRNDLILSNQIIYPINEIVKEFGFGLENSVPMAIVYAWYVGYKDIYLFGSGKYEYDNYPEMGHSLFQAIGFVRGKGCRFWFCSTAAQDNDVPYGYQKMLKKNIKD